MQGSFDQTTHTYHDSGGKRVPSVTQILQEAGLINYGFMHPNKREEVLARGETVHWVTELEDQGVLNPRKVPIRFRPYRKAYLQWKDRSGFVVQGIEVPFVSTYGYAGKPDRTGLLGGVKTVVDLKTGVAIADWVKYQLAPYALAVYGSWAVRRIALLLCADGTYKVKEFPIESLPHDFATFLAAKNRISKWALHIGLTGFSP